MFTDVLFNIYVGPLFYVVAMVCIHTLFFALYHWVSNYRKPDFGLSKKLFSDCMIWIEHV